MAYVFHVMASPVGQLKLIGSDKGLAGIVWEHDRAQRTPHLSYHPVQDAQPVLTETEKQLAEYFSGIRTAFDVPLHFTGTDFQQKVWHALLTIPYGETRSYGELAQQLGTPKAARAIGAANGKNPISIIAPCHRVIGANGTLTGFAGGLDTKAYLLQLETGRRFRP